VNVGDNFYKSTRYIRLQRPSLHSRDLTIQAPDQTSDSFTAASLDITLSASVVAVGYGGSEDPSYKHCTYLHHSRTLRPAWNRRVRRPLKPKTRLPGDPRAAGWRKLSRPRSLIWRSTANCAAVISCPHEGRQCHGVQSDQRNSPSFKAKRKNRSGLRFPSTHTSWSGWNPRWLGRISGLAGRRPYPTRQYADRAELGFRRWAGSHCHHGTHSMAHEGAESTRDREPACCSSFCWGIRNAGGVSTGAVQARCIGVSEAIKVSVGPFDRRPWRPLSVDLTPCSSRYGHSYIVQHLSADVGLRTNREFAAKFE
jgi:hypothetical protein